MGSFKMISEDTLNTDTMGQTMEKQLSEWVGEHPVACRNNLQFLATVTRKPYTNSL
jgi:hypothetical protein